MRSTIKQSYKATLYLDEEEAAWLKGVMQNPLTGGQTREDPKDYRMREKFFKALTPTTGEDTEFDF